VPLAMVSAQSLLAYKKEFNRCVYKLLLLQQHCILLEHALYDVRVPSRPSFNYKSASKICVLAINQIMIGQRMARGLVSAFP
jgi:hypothetical protein